MLSCKNFWTAQMYCIQMHFQRLQRNKTERHSHSAPPPSRSLSLRSLVQNSQVFAFQFELLLTKAQQKRIEKKNSSRGKVLGTKQSIAKVMPGIIRNWIRLHLPSTLCMQMHCHSQLELPPTHPSVPTSQYPLNCHNHTQSKSHRIEPGSRSIGRS